MFTGDGQITAASGDKLTFTVDPNSAGCPVDGDENAVALNGFAKVTGGTLKVVGDFNRKAAQPVDAVVGHPDRHAAGRSARLQLRPRALAEGTGASPLSTPA